MKKKEKETKQERTSKFVNLASSELHSRQTELDKEPTFKLPDLLPATVVGKELVPRGFFVRSFRITPHLSPSCAAAGVSGPFAYRPLCRFQTERSGGNFTYLTILPENMSSFLSPIKKHAF